MYQFLMKLHTHVHTHIFQEAHLEKQKIFLLIFQLIKADRR